MSRIRDEKRAIAALLHDAIVHYRHRLCRLVPDRQIFDSLTTQPEKFFSRHKAI
ncbi:MAG: hypothetical protein RM368_38400 [Nostoc sp. DedSLP03]|uniref:hypothetical protein n=1 Tax=Nostoc sp. DedSLP03 TaxID=3075400 RepID=UPI002AD2E8D4|nr:hypothetical protein [Nostoc sp. DedSLP03]MDZ7970734.1 hypothetical protein [Nostoc sp. DedSLP03]